MAAARRQRASIGASSGDGKHAFKNSRRSAVGLPEDASKVIRDQEINRIGLALAGVLREAREVAGLSKSALAQKAGISVQTVSFVESGTNSPSISTLLRFCSALEIDPVEIFEKVRRH